MTSNNVYTVNQIKTIESECGIPERTLMYNAANSVVRRLQREKLLQGDDICIVCGSGNNGGDGYAIGCILLESGFRVRIVPVVQPRSALAVEFSDRYVSNGGVLEEDVAAISSADTIIDCIFGFSFHGSADSVYAKAIELINHSEAFVVSVDLPSGICADSDELTNTYVKADITCTFTFPKLATVSYPAKEACGKVYIDDIGIDGAFFDKHTSDIKVADNSLLKLLPRRISNSHKGTYGTLLAVCGCSDMCGAAALSCMGALRSGVGLVRLFTDTACAQAMRGNIPEVLTSTDIEALDGALAKATALLIGCGCGRKHDKTIERLLLSATVPTVLDADGINFLAKRIDLYRSITCPIIVTPHPAEMSRLTGLSANEINASRVKCAQSFARKYGFVTVLKGAATVIAAPDGRTCINTTGNSGLSKGGSGDVLAGVIASLSAQSVPPFEAACIGVYLHGSAADKLAEEKGVYAMIPSEIPEVIGKIMYFG